MKRKRPLALPDGIIDIDKPRDRFEAQILDMAWKAIHARRRFKDDPAAVKRAAVRATLDAFLKGIVERFVP